MKFYNEIFFSLILSEEQRVREEEERLAREEKERKEREEREKLKAEEEARFLEETNNLNKALEGQREELDKWKEHQQHKMQVDWLHGIWAWPVAWPGRVLVGSYTIHHNIVLQLYSITILHSVTVNPYHKHQQEFQIECTYNRLDKHSINFQAICMLYFTG